MAVKIQLFILPFSGSKATQFDEFIEDLGDDVKADTIEYAGRGRRMKDPFFTESDLFMLDVCNYIQTHRDNSLPYALLGYSIGGLFAYDLIAKTYLEEEPCHLFIGACEYRKQDIRAISKLPEEEPTHLLRM